MHKNLHCWGSITNKNTVEKIEEIPEMESRINKLANITGNGPQLPSETTWLLPIMMLRNWKSVFFSLSFLESNKKK